MTHNSLLLQAKQWEKERSYFNLVLKDDLDPNIPITTLLLSQYATAVTDDTLSLTPEDHKLKLPQPLLFAFLHKLIKSAKYQGALRLLIVHGDRKKQQNGHILLFNISKLHQKLGDLSKQTFVLQNLLREQPFFPPAIFDLTLNFCRSGRREQAMSLLQRHLTKTQRQNSYLHSAFLYCLSQQNTIGDSLKLLHNRNLSTTNAYNLCLLLRKRKEFSKAIPILKQIIQRLNEISKTKLFSERQIKFLYVCKISFIKCCLETSQVADAKNIAEELLTEKTNLDQQTISFLIKVAQSKVSKSEKPQKETRKSAEWKQNGDSSFNNLFSKSREDNTAKLKYLLQKEKSIDNFFKNLKLKASQKSGQLLSLLNQSINSAKMELTNQSLLSQYSPKQVNMQISQPEPELKKTLQNMILNLQLMNSKVKQPKLPVRTVERSSIKMNASESRQKQQKQEMFEKKKQFREERETDSIVQNQRSKKIQTLKHNIIKVNKKFFGTLSSDRSFQSFRIKPTSTVVPSTNIISIKNRNNVSKQSHLKGKQNMNKERKDLIGASPIAEQLRKQRISKNIYREDQIIQHKDEPQQKIKEQTVNQKQILMEQKVEIPQADNHQIIKQLKQEKVDLVSSDGHQKGKEESLKDRQQSIIHQHQEVSKATTEKNIQTSLKSLITLTQKSIQQLKKSSHKIIPTSKSQQTVEKVSQKYSYKQIQNKQEWSNKTVQDKSVSNKSVKQEKNEQKNQSVPSENNEPNVFVSQVSSSKVKEKAESQKFIQPSIKILPSVEAIPSKQHYQYQNELKPEFSNMTITKQKSIQELMRQNTCLNELSSSSLFSKKSISGGLIRKEDLELQLSQQKLVSIKENQQRSQNNICDAPQVPMQKESQKQIDRQSQEQSVKEIKDDNSANLNQISEKSFKKQESSLKSQKSIRHSKKSQKTSEVNHMESDKIEKQSQNVNQNKIQQSKHSLTQKSKSSLKLSKSNQKSQTNNKINSEESLKEQKNFRSDKKSIKVDHSQNSLKEQLQKSEKNKLKENYASQGSLVFSGSTQTLKSKQKLKNQNENKEQKKGSIDEIDDGWGPIPKIKEPAPITETNIQDQKSEFNPLASTFNLTGFTHTQLHQFPVLSETRKSVSPLSFFELMAPSAPPQNIDICDELRKQLQEIAEFKRRKQYQEAYLRLLDCYKRFKADNEKLQILLEIGDMFELQNRIEEALKTYTKCTKFNSAQGFLRLGSLQLKKGKIDQGVQNLEKANCIHRFDIKIENRLVYGYSLKEETMEKALTLAHSILRKDPQSMETLLITAGILQRQGLIEEAIHIVTAMDEALEAEYIKHYLGILYLQASQLKEAFDCFKAALSLKPDYVPSLIEVASIVSQSHPSQAINILEKVLQLSPGNRKALARLGKIHESEGDFDNAMATYQTALNTQENYQSYMKIGDCLAKKECYLEALVNYKQALSLNKTSQSCAKVAKMYEQKSEWAKAVEYYQNALTLLPDTAFEASTRNSYLLAIGRLQLRLGQYQLAINSLQSSMEGEENIEVLKLMGEACFGNHQYSLALEYFQKASKAGAREVEMLENMAMCLDRMQEYLASKVIYEKILEKSPDNIRCMNNLANILLITGQTNEAFYLFETIIEKTPKNIQKRLKLADIYAQVGDWSKVQFHLLQCYKHREHDPRILEKLILLYKEKRDTKMALKYEKKLSMIRASSKPKQY